MQISLLLALMQGTAFAREVELLNPAAPERPPRRLDCPVSLCGTDLTVPGRRIGRG